MFFKSFRQNAKEQLSFNNVPSTFNRDIGPKVLDVAWVWTA